MSELLELQDVDLVFSDGLTPVQALSSVSLHFGSQERVAIVGASGCGKTSLLNVASGMLRPTGGNVLLQGEHIEQMNDAQRSAFRCKQFGFVFQRFFLIDHLSALENVALSLLIAKDLENATERAEEVLELVGLGTRLHHRPHQLSGGEQQRVAIARAVVGEPICVFADEPTGNLDEESTQAVLQLLSRTVVDRGGTLLLVTHDQRIASQMDRRVYIENGKPVRED